MNVQPEVVAVDLGGTWARVAAAERGRIIFEDAWPAIAPMRLPGALAVLWRERGWTTADRLIVGSKGVWTLSERRRLARGLASLAKRVTVLSDAEMALRAGAGNTRPALLLAAGTGSIAVGIDRRGGLVRAGGMGPGRGDEGSGWWIGNEFSKRFRAGKKSSPVADIAAQARRVLEKAPGDAHCAQIALEAREHLARLALKAASRLGKPPIPLLWAGSLLKNREFRRGIAAALEHRAPGRFRFLSPVLGLARRAALRPGHFPQRPPSSVPPRRGAKK